MSCSRPYYSPDVVNIYGSPVPIPCRTCECCRADRSAAWSERAKYEFSRFGVGAFVTFTYDDEHVPVGSDGKHFTLDYSHYHKFMDSIKHRSKKIFPSKPNKFVRSTPSFTYIGCAEYGDKFERPHYHILFFGLDFYECEEFLKKSWKHGSIEVNPIKPGAYTYVLKYIQKQVYGDLERNLYYDKGVLPPKIFFSRGFGRGLFYDNASDFRTYGYIKKGNRHINVPAYYAHKIMEWSVDSIIHLDNLRMEADFANYRNYQSFGGRLSYPHWKIKNRLSREYKLRSKKFKRCGDAILNRMYGVYANRPYIKDILDDIEFYSNFDDYKKYGDLVPF